MTENKIQETIIDKPVLEESQLDSDEMATEDVKLDKKGLGILAGGLAVATGLGVAIAKKVKKHKKAEGEDTPAPAKKKLHFQKPWRFETVEQPTDTEVVEKVDEKVDEKDASTSKKSKSK